MLTEENKEENILEGCLAALQQQGKPVEECLAPYPAQVEKLEPLLRLAVRLNSAGSLQASPQFQSAAPLRLHMQITGKLQPLRDGLPLQVSSTGPGIRRQARQHPLKASPRLGKMRLAQVFVGLLLALLIISGVGTAAASDQTLPGDFLYPIKRVQENLQLTITLNGASQVRLRMEFANRRINEATVLIRENRASAIDQALLDYNNQIRSELKFFNQESGLSSGEQSELASLLLSKLADDQTMLESMIKNAPESAKSNLETALTVSQSAQAQAVEVIHRQKSGGNQVLPSLLPPSSTPTPGPTMVPTSTPVPPNLTPTPIYPPRSGILPGLTRTPWTTLIPSARPPIIRVTPVPGNVLTPWPKPTWWVTPTRRPTRTPIWSRPTTWPIPTHNLMPTGWVSPTRRAPFSNAATPTP